MKQLDSNFSKIMGVGGSPGLVVMGGYEDCGFKSQHHVLDGHFFHIICCKCCNHCLKRRK